jgi:hypothetical protein
LVNLASREIANAVDFQQPQLGSSGDGAVEVQSKSKTKAAKLERQEKAAAKRNLRRLKKSAAKKTDTAGAPNAA